jgi:poly-gamma-glutamate synthesis protein (capsule biosynthesis protein)
MVVVLPFGNVIANRNRFDSVSWGNVFLTELMPDAERKLRVDPALRAIGGISRGGFWAYQIGLRHPELFRAIGGHSAFFDLYHAPPADNPLHLILDAPDLDGLALWLDRGKDDFASRGLDEMHTRMDERGLAHVYDVAPFGEHNNAYWGARLEAYLAWYGQALAPPAPLPTPAPVTFFATNTPDAPTFTPTPTSERGLYLPVVAFPSLQTSVSSELLQAIARGEAQPTLILDEEAHEALLQAGVALAPDVRVVGVGALRDALWRDRDAFTLVPFQKLTPELRVLWVDDAPVFGALEAYPFWRAGLTPAYDPQKLTRITVSGVTALTRNTLKALDAYGIDHAISGIAPYVRQSDFFHMSNEVSFAPDCPALNANVLGGATSFCSKREHFELFTRLGVSIVELTGNHNNDYGYQAYAETLAWYDANGIRTVGGGATVAQAQRPLVLEHHGNHIGWVACNSVGPYYALANEDERLLGGVRGGAADCNRTWLSETLARLKREVDVVVLTVQQREVEEYRPLPEHEAQFRRYAQWGADVVLGTAPHKPQTFEFVGQSFIHYGLGNLYFDQPFWGNMRFFMDTLLVYDGRWVGMELFAGIIEDNVRPRLMTPEERANFLFFMFRQQNGF